MTSGNMGFQKEKTLRARMNEKVIVCKVRNLAGDKAFLLVQEEHDVRISEQHKGATFSFFEHTEVYDNEPKKGTIIQVYENRKKKFIGVQFVN